MEMMKKGIKVSSYTVHDMETIFLRLITLGQTRHMELTPIFEFELCAVPPSLIDEFGCLQKGTKSTLVHKPSVSQSDSSPCGMREIRIIRNSFLHCTGQQTIVDSQNDGLYEHEEADVTILSYVLQAAIDGHKVIRILGDDTDIFVSLVYCVYKADITSAVQMGKWRGKVLSINAI